MFVHVLDLCLAVFRTHHINAFNWLQIIGKLKQLILMSQIDAASAADQTAVSSSFVSLTTIKQRLEKLEKS